MSEPEAQEPETTFSEPAEPESSAPQPSTSETTPAEVRAAIEAICMVADEPVPLEQLADVLDLTLSTAAELCAELAAEYQTQGRGFVLANVAGGWRFQSAPSQAANVERFVLDGQSSRMSGAALETLAIIAYKQPIARAQIAAIRGVSVDGVLKTLQQRGYVNGVGQIEGAGQAQFFGTSQLFLEKLGIASLEDLPPLGEFIPGADLVETLEQGLRPAAALDLEGDDEVDEPIAEPEPIIDLREDDPTVDEADEPSVNNNTVAADSVVAAADNIAPSDEVTDEAKKRWWRGAGRT